MPGREQNGNMSFVQGFHCIMKYYLPGPSLIIFGKRPLYKAKNLFKQTNHTIIVTTATINTITLPLLRLVLQFVEWTDIS